MAYNTIQDTQKTKRFGQIKKIVWFEITNIDGPFDVNLYITPNQNQNTSIVIFNQSSKEEKFNKSYPQSASTKTISETVKINYNKKFDSTIFGIKSL